MLMDASRMHLSNWLTDCLTGKYPRLDKCTFEGVTLCLLMFAQLNPNTQLLLTWLVFTALVFRPALI